MIQNITDVLLVCLKEHGAYSLCVIRKSCVILIHYLLDILQGIPGPRGQKGERGSSGPQVCFNMATENWDFKRCFLMAP